MMIISVNRLKKNVQRFSKTGSVLNVKKRKLIHDHEDAASESTELSITKTKNSQIK